MLKHLGMTYVRDRMSVTHAQMAQGNECVHTYARTTAMHMGPKLTTGEPGPRTHGEFFVLLLQLLYTFEMISKLKKLKRITTKMKLLSEPSTIDSKNY